MSDDVVVQLAARNPLSTAELTVLQLGHEAVVEMREKHGGVAESIGESALVETLSNGIADQYTSENIFKELRNQTDKARQKGAEIMESIVIVKEDRQRGRASTNMEPADVIEKAPWINLITRAKSIRSTQWKTRAEKNAMACAAEEAVEEGLQRLSAVGQQLPFDPSTIPRVHVSSGTMQRHVPQLMDPYPSRPRSLPARPPVESATCTISYL